MRTFAYIALVALLLTVHTAYSMTVLDFVTKQSLTSTYNAVESKCYGAVIDAGSSGSRVYVYHWDCRTKKQIPDVDITQDAQSKKINTPISAFSKDMSGVDSHIQLLITYVKETVPDTQESYTPIYFRATAGMRLLSTTDQETILTQVKATLKNSTLLFQDDWATVLPGQLEGAYGWVSLNYIYKLLSATIDASATRAAIDLGGASVQFTFIPTSTPKSDLVTLNVEGLKSYGVYTHSYLGYGNDQARYSVLALAPKADGVISSPCHLSGFNATGIVASNTTLRVIGTGNVTECKKLIKQFLNVTESDATSSINGQYQAPLPANIRITSFSAIVYAVQFWKMNSTVTLQDVSDVATNFCEKNYDDAKGTDAYSHTYCFLGQYYVSLLNIGFKVPMTATLDITNNIGPMSINWALGSLVYDVSQLPCKLNTEACVAQSSMNTEGSTDVSGASQIQRSVLAVFIAIVMIVFMFQQ